MAGFTASDIDSLQLSPKTAQRLAALIAADAQQLEERVEQQGVTAFLGRAVKRERPNERFLQNTLRNLVSANKRQEERAMWAAWEAEQQQQQHRADLSDRGRGDRRVGRTGCKSDQRQRYDPRQDRKRSPSYSRSPEKRSKQCTERAGIIGRGSYRQRSRSRTRSGREISREQGMSREDASKGSELNAGVHQPDGAPLVSCHEPAQQQSHESGSARTPDSWSDGVDGSTVAAGDTQLLAWLAGSKAVKGRGSIGPHADVAGPYLPAPADDVQQRQHGSTKGPAKPSWLKHPAADEERLRPSAAFLQGVLATQGIKGGAVQNPGDATAAAAPGADWGGSASSNGSDGSSGSSGRHKSSKKRKHKCKHGRSKTKKSKQHNGHKKHKHRKAHKQHSHEDGR